MVVPGDPGVHELDEADVRLVLRDLVRDGDPAVEPEVVVRVPEDQLQLLGRRP